MMFVAYMKLKMVLNCAIILFYGDPVYFYTTLKGAKIAMTRMNNGIYRDLKFPSTNW